MLLINDAEGLPPLPPGLNMDNINFDLEDDEVIMALDGPIFNALNALNAAVFPGPVGLDLLAIRQAVAVDAMIANNDGQGRRPAAVAAPLPPCVCEAVEELHTSLISCYSHLLLLCGRAESTVTESSRRLGQAIGRLRAALVCTRRRSLQAIFAAASTWRTLRHSIAYTLIDWERVCRKILPILFYIFIYKYSVF